ncbi:hypothetical protein M0812_14183 [Anaeramoeba flamelloides]|uniref:Calponin-homology (CH) domain-containing protein n=1 Tax=Anaeramoeba flamelloides TaxID=1746091 RepID=A0AAV7ZKJ7_9EUKA|nr:hypothetical protein M0812_14183 [Anaeramoeba flamelloides]
MNESSVFLWPRFSEGELDPISEQIKLNQNKDIQKAVGKTLRFARKVLKYPNLTVGQLFSLKGIQLCNLLNVVVPTTLNRIVKVAHLKIQQTENLKELQNTMVLCCGYPKNDLFSITGLTERATSDLRQLLNLLIYLQDQIQKNGIIKQDENSIRNFYILEGEIEKIDNIIGKGNELENQKEVNEDLTIDSNQQISKLLNSKATKEIILTNKYFNQPEETFSLSPREIKKTKQKTFFLNVNSKKRANTDLGTFLKPKKSINATKNKSLLIEKKIIEQNFVLVKYTIKNSQHFDGSRLINVSKWLKRNKNKNNNNKKKQNKNTSNLRAKFKRSKQLTNGEIEAFFFLNTIDRWDRLKIEWVPPKNKTEFKKTQQEYEREYLNSIQYIRCSQYVFPVLAGNNLKVFEPAELIVNPKNVSVVVNNSFTKFNCSWSSGDFLLAVSKQDSSSLLSLTLLLGSKSRSVSKNGNVSIHDSAQYERYYIKADDHHHKHMLVMLLLLYQTQHNKKNKLKIIGNNPKVSRVNINTINTSILPPQILPTKKLKPYFFNVNEFLTNISFEKNQKIFNNKIIQKISTFFKKSRIIFPVFNVIKRKVPFLSVFLDLRKRGIIFNNGKNNYISIPFCPQFMITKPNNNNKIIKLSLKMKNCQSKTVYFATKTENESKFISKSILFFFSKWKQFNI